MDKFQAAFEVLYLLAIIDGDFDDAEVDVINKFINDNYGSSDFDTHEVMRTLSNYSHDKQIEEIGYAAALLNDACSKQEKLNILDFAYGVIKADRDATDDEAVAFVVVCDMWEVDYKRFLNH